ncbi:MAG: N-formylglutamate amidohydrolase [Pseudomonadota bacterium]
MTLDFTESTYPSHTPDTPARTSAENTLLSGHDPEPFIIKPGNSPIVIMGPHNGSAVPRKLYYCDKPLGIDADLFDSASSNARHDLVDINVEKFLWRALQSHEILQHAHFIEATYSRAVVDPNRSPEHARAIITQTSGTTSSTHGVIQIPGNKNLSQFEINQRMQTIYDAYHDALADLILSVREEYGYVILLDIHSFTPELDGQKRAVEFGPLNVDNNPHALELERFARRDNSYVTRNGKPFDLRPGMPDNGKTAALSIIERTGAHYAGLEFRNDKIANIEGGQRAANFTGRFVTHLQPELILPKHYRAQSTRISNTPTPEPKASSSLPHAAFQGV